mgnify:CR=1 FL=1
MSSNERNDDASLHDAQDQLINAAAIGRPNARQVRFSKAAMLEGSMSLLDPRLWPLHAAAVSFVLLVIAAIAGMGKQAQSVSPEAALAYECSPEGQCGVIEQDEGGWTAFDQQPKATTHVRRTPMIAPGDQFSISPAPVSTTQTSDARPMIDYTVPANL